ncbi:MAG: energy transducer TonB [Sulfurovum sp.]|nr:energy transducer TonB [Sulfurovum sp.]
MKNHFSVSFFLTLFIYLGMIALFLSFSSVHIGAEQKPQEKIIILTMSEFVPEVIPPVEEVEPEKIEEPETVEPEPEPPKEETEQEKTKPEEPVLEEVKPEPVVEKVIPKPVVKKVVKKKPKKRIKKKVKKRVEKKVAKKIHKKVKPTKRASKPQTSPAKKNRFLNQLRAKINRYKAYPRIAQRRGMQGAVKVRFTILKNGKVSSISVSGPKVFHTSARKAVKKAFPINTKNTPLSLPMVINVTLRYRIR